MALHDVYLLIMSHKSRFCLVYCAFTAAFAHGFALAEDAKAPASAQPPGVIDKVGKSVERGAKAAVNGVETGVNAAARGIERGATAAANGIERGVKATERVVEKITNKTTGSSSSEAQK